MTSPATHDETVAFFAEHGGSDCRPTICGSSARARCRPSMPQPAACCWNRRTASPSVRRHGGTLAALDRSGALDESSAAPFGICSIFRWTIRW